MSAQHRQRLINPDLPELWPDEARRKRLLTFAKSVVLTAAVVAAVALAYWALTVGV